MSRILSITFLILFSAVASQNILLSQAGNCSLSDLYEQNIIQNIRRLGACPQAPRVSNGERFLNSVIPSNENGKVVYSATSGMFGSCDDFDNDSTNCQPYVLAWQCWQSTNTVESRDTTVPYEEVHALVLYRAPEGDTIHRVMYIVAEGRGTTEWKWLTFFNFYNDSISNERIYANLEEWGKRGRCFIAEDLSLGVSSSMVGAKRREFNGIELEYRGGGIVEEEWERAVGEKPTRVFPLKRK